ncbi:hypothetical protein BD770DRAFT_395485 [Pilaira anomala]|nr:hypothetical protein BD770DRAFT_395485 [Pilaira anomala]
MKIPGITAVRLNHIFSAYTKLTRTCDSFSVKAIPNRASTINRVAIITGKKKISKSAVIRNRADRRIKAAIQTVYPHLKAKGYDYIVFSLPPVITIPWPKLVEQVNKAFSAIDNMGAPKNKRKP